MKTTEAEAPLRALGVDPESPHTLLALPFAAVVTADGPISPIEKDRIVRFFHTRLAFDNAQDRALRQWLEAPPNKDDVDLALVCLRRLRRIPDALAIENSVLTEVLVEAEQILREAGPPEARPQGRELLPRICTALEIDLGVAWDELAPSELEDEGAQQARDRAQPPEAKEKTPLRRHRANARLKSESVGERGGLV